MALVKNLDQLRDLAPWFDITIYDECEKLTPTEWADALSSKRANHFFRSIVRDHPDKEPSSIFSVEGAISTYGVAFVDPLDRNLLWRTKDSKLLSFQGDINPKSIVKPLHWSDAENNIHDFDIPPNAHHLTYDEVSQLQFSQANLVVDLTATDSALIKSFKTALKKYRDHFKVPSPSKIATKKNIEKLRDYRILAYLDIKNWAFITDNEVTNNAIAWALFNGQEGERFVSDTVKPLADAAITTGFISTLRDLDATTEG